MQKRFALLFVLVGVLAVASRAAWAMQDYYVDPSQVDLIISWRHHLLLTRMKVRRTCRQYWRRSTLERKPR